MISIIAHTGVIPTAANATANTTSAIDTTGANKIFVGVGNLFAAVDASNIALTDSKGNTFNFIGAGSGGSTLQCGMYECDNPIVGSGHTFTATEKASGGYPSVFVIAVSGADTTSAYDQQHGNASSSSATIQPGSTTPTVNNEILVTFLSCSTPSSMSIDSGFTITDNLPYTTGTAVSGAMAYLIQTTATTSNPTWTQSPANLIAAFIASFKSAAVAWGWMQQQENPRDRIEIIGY